MKKIITLLLTVTLLLSLGMTVIAEEPVNYAKDAVWGVGSSIDSVKITDGVAVASAKLWMEWSSPAVDLLPALKEALGDKDEVEVTITFDARAQFTSGNEGGSVSALLLFRGKNGLDINTKTEWNEAYSDSIDGEDALFFMDTQGNLMYRIEGAAFEANDDDWSTCEINLSLTKNQINSPALTKWNLSIHSISSPDTLSKLELKNLKLVHTSEYEPAEPEKPIETEKPATDEKPATTKAPTATKAPDNNASNNEGSTNTNVSTDNNSNSNSNNSGSNIILSTIIACLLIVISTVISFILVKKRK